jgi:tetratricopeptide (TPR) repeat protein
VYCSLSRRYICSACLLAIVLVSCQRKTQGPPPRYAVVRFENLSGDPSLEWIARAASEYLSYSLAHALDGAVLNPDALARRSAGLGVEPSSAPGISAQRTDALIAGASRLISGILEKDGNQIRLTATDEDLATHETVRIVTAIEPKPMQAMAQLAHEIAPAAAPYLTSSSDALRLYATGLEKPPAEAVPDLEEALQKDPDFGPAWVTLANIANVRGDRAGALAVIARTSAKKIDPRHRASLDLIRATLTDDRTQRIEALRRVSALSPADTSLMRSLAELETAGGRFSDAAQEWAKVLSVSPEDPDALNQEGYARAWGGDFAGALAALRQYAQVRPADANPLDSVGDVDYMYRKFPDAAASYLQAHAKSPQFQNGGELYKAAWAQFKSGDKAKADAGFHQFRAAREKAGGTGLDLFEADWLYRTGRGKAAVEMLRKAPASPVISSQLAVWDLLAGDRAAAAKEFAGVGQMPSTAVLIARFAALPSATAAEWQERSEKMIRGNGADAVRHLALALALILDGKKDAARPVMEKIVETSPSTDFFSRAILAKLKGEHPKLELLPDPLNVNQMRALAD